GHRRLLLPDRDVEAVNALPFLVDDRVDGHRRLADLAIADDELALAAADRHHGIDRLDPGLKRLFHRLAREDAGGLDLDPPSMRALDWALAIDRVAERIDDPADERLADRNIHDAPGALDGRALFDLARVPEERRPDVVRLEVEDQAHDVARE